MEKIIIKGGHRLSGRVAIEGAKMLYCLFKQHQSSPQLEYYI